MPNGDAAFARMEGEVARLIDHFRRDMPAAVYIRADRWWYDAGQRLHPEIIRSRLRDAARDLGIRTAGMVETAVVRLREHPRTSIDSIFDFERLVPDDPDYDPIL